MNSRRIILLLTILIAGATFSAHAGSANAGVKAQPARNDERAAAPAFDSAANPLRPVPSLLYTLPNYQPPATGDLDGDGAIEIFFFDPSGEKFLIYDAATGAFERELSLPSDGLNHGIIAAGQLDGDAQDELVDSGYGTAFVLDGLTGELQWSKGSSSAISTAVLHVGQLDADPVDEIVELTAAGLVSIRDGQTGDIQWSAGEPSASYTQMNGISVGDLNSDGLPDLVISSNSVWSAYYGPDFNLAHKSTESERGMAAIVNRDGIGNGVVVVLRGSELGEMRVTVDVYDGNTFQFIRRAFDEPVYQGVVDGQSVGTAQFFKWIEAADVDGDGIEEFVLSGVHEDFGTNQSKTILLVDDWNSPYPFPELRWFNPGENYRPIYLADIDGDPAIEFALAGNGLQVFDTHSEELRLFTSHISVVAQNWPQPRLFTDDFSDPASGWPVVSNGAFRTAYVDGAFRLNVIQGRTIAGVLAPVPFEYLDYEVSVESKWLGGDDDMARGIIFDWLDWDNYKFLLALAHPADFVIGIFGYVDGEFVTYVDFGTDASSIPEEWDKIAIRRVRDGFTLWLDGSLQYYLFKIPRPMIDRPVRVGVIAVTLDNKGGIFAFDNFSLQEIWRDGRPPLDPSGLSGRQTADDRRQANYELRLLSSYELTNYE